MTSTIKKRRRRDPVATRAVILDAAASPRSPEAPDGMTLSAVAKLAGGNRGTAYQHFETREKLVGATMQMGCDRIFREVFGDPEVVGERQVEKVPPNFPKSPRSLPTKTPTSPSSVQPADLSH